MCRQGQCHDATHQYHQQNSQCLKPHFYLRCPCCFYSWNYHESARSWLIRGALTAHYTLDGPSRATDTPLHHHDSSCFIFLGLEQKLIEDKTQQLTNPSTLQATSQSHLQRDTSAGWPAENSESPSDRRRT